MTLRNILLLTCASALFASCNSGEAPDDADAAATVPELTPAPVPTAAPDGTALVAGSWEVNENAQGVRASFGEVQSEASLVIECNAQSGAVSLTLADAANAPKSFAVEAGGQAARLDMVPTGAEVPTLSAEIEPTLALFNAFSEPDTVIAFTAEDGTRAQYPTHPGINRVLDRCM